MQATDKASGRHKGATQAAPVATIQEAELTRIEGGFAFAGPDPKQACEARNLTDTNPYAWWQYFPSSYPDPNRAGKCIYINVGHL